jgi:hypothetical protein
VREVAEDAQAVVDGDEHNTLVHERGRVRVRLARSDGATASVHVDHHGKVGSAVCEELLVMCEWVGGLMNGWVWLGV